MHVAISPVFTAENEKSAAHYFPLFGLSLGLIYRQPKKSAFDNSYSVKRFNAVNSSPYREMPGEAVPTEDEILMDDHPDNSVFRNLENIYEMVLEAKNEVDDLKDGVTQEYEKILRRYQKQAAGALV
ncbi:Oidioi.mRNA.OKI2018_I69.XSR.g13462.t1.cds [Oikopleura dioica]|uniref:Oidioi.mRNA.OKI2018_I69.XSR.g13462.t1.cds n=1 Tax=Oikopleura dioica TaxID=34765 RepID=A0ABN7SBN1_OIKDI|nr:Oidioi.mRNA.OKI2018_I69.XSR.g13462.t1.cds [Oikopleura dioica]